MLNSLRDKKRNRSVGQALVETPIVLYILFFLMFFPMMALGTTLFRAVLFYFTVRESVIRASRAPTFTDAQNNASTVFANDTWYATRGTEQVFIVTQNLATGVNSYSSTKLAYGTIDVSQNMYLIQAVAQARIKPLVALPLFGLSVPGLTGEYPVTIKAQTYSENPSGLWE